MTKLIEQYGFLGVLKGSYINQLDSVIIEGLIDRNILIEDFINYGTPDSCPIYLEGFIYYYDQAFKLNPNMLEELYSLINFYIETTSDYYYELQPILYKLNAIIDIDEKVKFLKKSYKKIYPKEWQTYSMFRGNGTNGIQNWKDWVFLSFEGYPNLLNHALTWQGMTIHIDASKDAKEYIESLHICHHFINSVYENKSTMEDDFFDFLNEWKLFYEKEKQLAFILDKIEELEEKRNGSDEFEKLEMVKPGTIDITENSEKSKLHNSNILSNLEVAYFAYYMKEAKENFIPERFPSEAGYKFLGDKYGPNWKNIQQSYLEIKKDRDKRLTESRYHIIKKIVPLLTPVALSIAESELISI